MKQLSILMVTLNTSMLVGFTTRLYGDIAIPVNILRILLTLSFIAIACIDKQTRNIFLGVTVALNTGLLLSHWDEIYLLYNFRFAEVFLIPVVILTLFIPVVISLFAGYVSYKKSHSIRSYW